jgi:endonuclease-3
MAAKYRSRVADSKSNSADPTGPGQAAHTKAVAKRRARPGRSRLSRAEIAALYGRLRAANPEPKGELEYLNPYTLLIAVVLSAQATDAGVNRATRPLFAIADTPQKMLALGEPGVKEAIRSLGFFNTKTKSVLTLSRMLVEQYGGEVPRDRQALEALPGVGRKTASVVLNTAFGEPAIAVDTHVFRVSNRTGLAPGATADDVTDILERVTPAEFKLHAHHWLILHGRYVCVARKPKCPACVIADICRFKEKTQPAGRLSV